VSIKRPVLLSAPDKFKGSLTGTQFSAATGRAATGARWDHSSTRLSDGGEGFGELLADRREARTALVSGPLGDEVVATWWLGDRGEKKRAVIESQLACGLMLAGGREKNDPVAATTTGVGQLINEALSAGADEVIVGCGGSASTDGGRGALEALFLFPPPAVPALEDRSLFVAYDVAITFLEAAKRFGPQKGASFEQVRSLEERLERLASLFEQAGRPVAHLPGSGAAGGLAGGLAAAGGRLVSGFQLVAEAVGLEELVAGASAVVTGEGHLDSGSFEGKVLGGLVETARRFGKPVLCIAGGAEEEAVARAVALGAEVAVLGETYGLEASLKEPAELVTQVCRAWLASLEL
jgi:glycerate kinase